MRIAIIGGTGFVGSYIIDALLAAGHELRLLARPGSENKLEPARGVSTVSGDIDDERALRDTLDGADAVVYLVGILREFPKQRITFERMQYQGAVDVSDIAAELGIRRFLLMSANGVDAEATAYQRTKHRAERHVRDGDFDVTIFRPSVVFGDPRGRMEFATQLYQDIVRLPVPAIGFHSGFRPSAGAVLMSPVAAEDVAAAFARALDDPATIGRTYELGGPETLSWVDMIRRVADAVGKRKIILRDQLTMLEQGNVCSDSELRTLIGREPRAFSADNLAYLRG